MACNSHFFDWNPFIKPDKGIHIGNLSLQINICMLLTLGKGEPKYTENMDF